MVIGVSVQAILRFGLRNLRGRNAGTYNWWEQFETLQYAYWYYWPKVFEKYAFEMVSCDMIYTPGVQAILSSCLDIWEAVILVLLMDRICELHRWDGLRCHDIHTKFHTDWFSNPKVGWATHWHRQHCDLISLLLFFQNKEIGLIMGVHEL
jgi:hypothetical protein